MSSKYDEYIEQHKNNVYEAFFWIRNNVPEIFGGDDKLMSSTEYQCKFNHDNSKLTPEEYIAYDSYFYGRNRSYEVVQEFNRAWLHHIHNNPHHWQYWILNNDDPEKGEIKLEMPDMYIIEMICDWWSFSIAKNNMYEIFDWYDQRKNYIKLNNETRQKVENILEIIYNKLLQLEKKEEERNNTETIVVEDVLEETYNKLLPYQHSKD